jgi:hypothetical protein
MAGQAFYAEWQGKRKCGKDVAGIDLRRNGSFCTSGNRRPLFLLAASCAGDGRNSQLISSRTLAASGE